MDAPTLIAALAVAVAVVAGLLPWIAALERTACAATSEGLAPEAGGGLRRVLADWLRTLRGEVPGAGAPRSTLARFAPALAAAPVLAAFAVVPFAPFVRAGDLVFRGVVADLDAGLLIVLAIAALTVHGPVLFTWTRGGADAARGALRVSAQRGSYLVMLALAALTIALIGDSLQLGALTRAQDRSVALFGLAVSLGWIDALPPALAWLRVPAWGGVLQPLALLLFLAGLLGVGARAPFDGPEREASRPAGFFVDDPGHEGGIGVLADAALVGVGAALTVSLFLGGWSLPFVSHPTLLAAFTAVLPDVVAAGLCFAIHTGVFVAKLLAVVCLLDTLRFALPRLAFQARLRWAWRALLPLALANLFATAFVLLQLESTP